MSPRPRTVDDAAILMACQRVMQRVGPSSFTLALVAKEAGLAPATIVQRFGSKRELIRTLASGARGQGAAYVAELRTRFTSPLAILREFLLCWSQMASTPEEMANHLAYLQMDLTDPVLLENLVELSAENLQHTAALLREAHAAGELTIEDAEGLSRALNATVSGGLLAWATFREGTARAWLERDLDVLLAPLQAK
ncbi:MAG: TetR/AcrR family transcriptional regulator [Cytophagaceae bacterium]|nr:TetR/AcrR family transcriptional regulator [Gemmatimonadaceae bacterium]